MRGQGGQTFGVAMIVEVVPISIAAEVLVILKKDTAATI